MHANVASPVFLTLKAALAAGLAAWACSLLPVADALSAAFVAMLTVSPTVVTGLRRSLEQLVAAVAAGFIGAALVMTGLPRELDAALAVAASVGLAFALGWGRTYVVAGFSALYVVIVPGHAAWDRFGIRVGAVLVGCLCAVAVNAVVTAPFYASVFRRRLARVRAGLVRALHAASAGDPAPLRTWDGAAQQVLGELDDARTEAPWRPGFPREELARLAAELDAMMRCALLVRAALTTGPDDVARERLEEARRQWGS